MSLLFINKYKIGNKINLLPILYWTKYIDIFEVEKSAIKTSSLLVYSFMPWYYHIKIYTSNFNHVPNLSQFTTIHIIKSILLYGNAQQITRTTHADINSMMNSISSEFHSISKSLHHICTKPRKLHRTVSRNKLLSYLSERYNPLRLITQIYR